MKIDYYSDEVFTLPATEVITNADETGMTWALLGYLQQRCLDNSHSQKGLGLLIEVYKTLNCPPNCWYLSQKYLFKHHLDADKETIDQYSLGLDIGVCIKEDLSPSRFKLAPAENMWEERDFLLNEIKNEPQSLFLWTELVGKYIELDELLMAVMILILVRLNIPYSASVSSNVNGHLDLIKAYGTSGSFWAFITEDLFLTKLREILNSHSSKQELVRTIAEMFESCFGLSVNPGVFLQSFSWNT